MRRRPLPGLLLACLGTLASCQATSPRPQPIRITATCPVPYPVDWEKELDKTREFGDQEGVPMYPHDAKGGQTGPAKLCRTGREWLTAKKEGLSADTTAGLVAEQWMILPIHTAWRLKGTKPAHRSFLRDFRMAEVAASDLPSDVQIFDDVDETTGKRSLAEAYPCGKRPQKDPVDQDSVEFMTGEAGECVVLTVLAFGDFDGDGLEDILVHEYSHSGGSASGCAVSVFTRRKPGGPLERVPVRREP